MQDSRLAGVPTEDINMFSGDAIVDGHLLERFFPSSTFGAICVQHTQHDVLKGFWMGTMPVNMFFKDFMPNARVPILWATILNIDPNSAHWVKQLLLRSKNLPLKIQSDASMDKVFANSGYGVAKWKLIFQEMHRIRVLHILLHRGPMPINIFFEDFMPNARVPAAAALADKDYLSCMPQALSGNHVSQRLMEQNSSS